MKSFVLEKKQKTRQSHYADITEISKHRRENSITEVDELSSITIPTRIPANIEMSFTTKRRSNGQRFQILINSIEVGSIRYDQEYGDKTINIDVTNYLKCGINELRVRTLITSNNFSENSDIAKFILFGEGNTIIRKEYRTKCSIEPIDQIWTLRVI